MFEEIYLSLETFNNIRISFLMRLGAVNNRDHFLYWFIMYYLIYYYD